MIIGLDDFDVDIFLTFDDKNIKLYYSDFDTIPELVKIVPLGAFDGDTETYQYTNMILEDRIKVALLFMQRDMYAYVDHDTKEIMINRELNPDQPHTAKAAFMTEFGNIPEVVAFFDVYKDICEHCNQLNYEIPDSWIGWNKAAPKTENNPEGLGWWYEDLAVGKKYIDWTNYPHWCQDCADYTFGDHKCECAYVIPIEVMPPADIYYVSLVYFNGIYRTKPESVQDFGVYNTLTDINFDLNKYSMIVDIKEFFTKEFQWFLQTIPGDLPFGCDYGTHIKHAVQTKDTDVRRIEIQNEINFFIYNFNAIWGDLVQVNEINILSQQSKTGGGSWLVEVFAKIKEERLIFRIEEAS